MSNSSDKGDLVQRLCSTESKDELRMIFISTFAWDLVVRPSFLVRIFRGDPAKIQEVT